MFKKILIVGLFSFMCAMPVYTVADVSSVKIKSTDELPYILPAGKNFTEIVISNKQIDNGSSIEVELDEIAGYSNIDFHTSSVSSGNITTGSVTWYDFLDNSYGSVVITSGVGVTDFKASNAIFTFYNPVAVTNNVTMNIVLK
jgi:hypothetical protein